MKIDFFPEPQARLDGTRRFVLLARFGDSYPAGGEILDVSKMLGRIDDVRLTGVSSAGYHVVIDATDATDYVRQLKDARVRLKAYQGSLEVDEGTDLSHVVVGIAVDGPRYI